MSLLATYLIFFFGSIFAFQSQQLPEKGVPYLKNFTPADYDHKGKIWSIDTAPNGIAYMASNSGILEYDGREWKNYSGSDGITRSLVVVNDSLIYTGSDLDFGVWKRNEYLEFEYTSLYPFREALTGISEEFWDIHYIDDNVLFVSANNIYVYSEGNLTKIAAPTEIQNSFTVSETLYFLDEGGLFRIEDLSPKQVPGFPKNNIPQMIGAYEYEGSLIMISQNSGLYQYKNEVFSQINTELSQVLNEGNVFSFEQIDDTHLAFGTILDGLYISDKNGNILHHINKNKGLQNNTVLSMHQSSFGHLWLGMDYGVSFLDLSNEHTFFYDYRGNFGTGYSAILRDDTFYLGTNQGLYKTDWNELNNYRSEFDNFEIIEGSEGQVWSLTTIEDQIWIGHDRGLFTLQDNKLNRLSDLRGVWTIQPYKDHLLVGTYNGISIFRKENSEWSYWKQMELIVGSCNQILIEDEQTIWVNIPNYGVIRASLDDDLYPTEREIYLSEEFDGNNQYLRSEEDGVQVLTDTHKFEYSASEGSFSGQIQDQLNSKVEDVLQGTTKPVLLNSEFEFYPIYNGFALKNLSMQKSKPDTAYQLVFRNVKAYNNDEVRKAFGGAELSYTFNNLRVESIVPNQEDVEYQFKTDANEEWSDWSGSGVIELIGMKYGDSQLSVRANVDGTITAAENIYFSVNPPWYRTWYAYTAYIFMAYILIWVVYFIQGAKLKKQKKALLKDQRKSLHKQEKRYRQKIKEAEEAKLKAEFENVKEQLKSKTIELATKARENDEKNRILESLNEKLKRIEENPENIERRVTELQQIVDSHINSDDNTFEIQIDELHKDFYSTLRNEFSELTRYDLRLCAYIKLGFDSKEISNLLNIKPSSVYISRSRLRKKLNIESDEDLHGYLGSL